MNFSFKELSGDCLEKEFVLKEGRLASGYTQDAQILCCFLPTVAGF